MANSLSIPVVADVNVAAANDVVVQHATRSEEGSGNLISIARRIVESWPDIQENLQPRQPTVSSLDKVRDQNVEKFHHLISLLGQFTTGKTTLNARMEAATSKYDALPLQRFLEDEDEWQGSMEGDSTNGGPDSEIEAQLQNGKSAAVTEELASPYTSCVSLIADSALSTAVSDDTVVIDKDTIPNHHKARQQLDEESLRDLNEKLCRIVTSGQATKNIIARATDLIDAGADVNARDEWCDGTIYDQLWKDNHSRSGWLRATVLYGAVASRADCEVIRLLLSKGAEINRRGGFSGTPLQAIVQTDEKNIARLLLNRGADINAAKSSFGYTNILLAANYGTVGMVELLLERGAQVTEVDSRNATALHAAAHRGHVGMIKLLLDRGASIDEQMHQTGVTPLSNAVRMAHPVAVQTLLARGADVRLLEPMLITYGVASKRERLIDILKEYGVDYACSAPASPPPRPERSSTYNLVRQGNARLTFPENIPVPQNEKPVTMETAVREDGGSLLECQSNVVERHASHIIDTNQPRETEDTDSIMSSQTNLTAKTETKRRKKFWSRFSSQTTLHDNN